MTQEHHVHIAPASSTLLNPTRLHDKNTAPIGSVASRGPPVLAQHRASRHAPKRKHTGHVSSRQAVHGHNLHTKAACHRVGGSREECALTPPPLASCRQARAPEHPSGATTRRRAPLHAARQRAVAAGQDEHRLAGAPARHQRRSLTSQRAAAAAHGQGRQLLPFRASPRGPACAATCSSVRMTCTRPALGGDEAQAAVGTQERYPLACGPHYGRGNHVRV